MLFYSCFIDEEKKKLSKHVQGPMPMYLSKFNASISVLLTLFCTYLVTQPPNVYYLCNRLILGIKDIKMNKEMVIIHCAEFKC